MSYRPLSDIHGYRGVEYSVFETKPGEWQWKYYPKVEQGNAKGGITKGSREAAILAMRAAVDQWLGPVSPRC
jgi:hypothetical protein